MGVWIMAGVTFREAARKKMLWMALAAGGAFLILFGTGLHFQAKDFAAHGMSPVLRREKSFPLGAHGPLAVDLLAGLMANVPPLAPLPPGNPPGARHTCG